MLKGKLCKRVKLYDAKHNFIGKTIMLHMRYSEKMFVRSLNDVSEEGGVEKDDDE